MIIRRLKTENHNSKIKRGRLTTLSVINAAKNGAPLLQQYRGKEYYIILEVFRNMKKILTIALVIVLTFALAITTVASPGQNPNQNPGSPEMSVNDIRITATGGGNNLQLLAIHVDGRTAVIPRAGNGTFTQTFDVFGGYTGIIQVQGNSLRSVAVTGVPYVCTNLCVDCEDCFDCSDAILCECEEYVGKCEECCGCGTFSGGEPIVVNLGFIGHYLHDGRVLTTSFYWQTLNEGDLIDWDAVEAAYAGWVAQGGLAPDTSNGWQSSGFAPIFFANGADIGHGDFSFSQLEGFYRAYFVATGYTLPYVCSNICEVCNVCLDCGECECEGELSGTPQPPVNRGCENCEGNRPDRRCDGRGCDGNGSGPPGGGNQQ